MDLLQESLIALGFRIKLVVSIVPVVLFVMLRFSVSMLISGHMTPGYKVIIGRIETNFNGARGSFGMSISLWASGRKDHLFK